MIRTLLSVLLALSSLAVALPAQAGKGAAPVPPTVTTSSRHDNQIYAGVNWNFGVRTGATAVLGFRAANVNADGRVHGAKAEVSYVLSGAPMGFGEARVKYLVGARDSQIEVGVGYSVQGEAFLANLGLQGPYLTGGTDYLFGKGFLPYVGINTLGRVRDPKQTTSCPPNLTLENDGFCEID